MIELKDLGNVSIMIVEDDEFNQELASAIFDEYEQITIHRANNGEEALDILKHRSIDIILLDLMMPQMDGFELLKLIKNSEKYREIPVIIVTAEELERKRTYLLGANDFISKPYNPTELKMRVLNNLKIRKFYDILVTIKSNAEDQDDETIAHRDSIKNALEIALHSQKKLFQKLGNMAHECGHADKHASERLGNYASLLATQYGLNSSENDHLYHTMSIYDIGFLRVPKEKRKDVDSKEFKKHPELGLEILEDLEGSALMEIAKIVTIEHHENWDGSGYPNRISGESISIYARIATIADYFDELTMNRYYSQSNISSSDALEIMKREKSLRLDPNLLDLFEDNFYKFEAIKEKYSTI